MKALRESWEAHEQNTIGLLAGDIVTLIDGRRGKVASTGSDGEFLLLSGKGKPLSYFYPGDIARIDRHPPKRIRIYQAELESEFMFQGAECFRAKGLAAPPAESYRIVFDGQIGTDLLAEVFRIFNTDHPQGYTGRSLSVSDVVELYDSKGSRYYYCDTFGFKRIPFKPVKLRYVLFAVTERESSAPQTFSSFDKAFRQMRSELLSQLGSRDTCGRGTDYDITNDAAWSNCRVKVDWNIFRHITDIKGHVKLSQIPQKKIVIWTYFNTPFSMGGQKQPTGCEVDVVEKLALGHGFFGYRVPTPYWGDVICEEHSGAIVGHSIEMVRKDVAAGSFEMMRRQVADACSKRKTVEIIDSQRFWSVYLKSNQEASE